MTDKELASNIEKILGYKRAIVEIERKIAKSTDREIKFCRPETIYLQIYNGIHEIAKAFSQTLKFRSRYCAESPAEYPYEAYFYIDDTLVVELLKA